MRSQLTSLIAALALVACGTGTAEEVLENGGGGAAAEEPVELAYRLVEGWIRAPEEIGGVSGVTVDAAGNVYAFRRDGNDVWVLDGGGNLVKAWGEGIARWTHGIRVDHEGFIWTSDGQGHQIKKWSPDASRLLLTLGQYDVAGDGPDTFNRPTDVAVAPNGDLFVSDGYVNSRVVRFTRDGRFVRSWGESGTGPGQFNTVHSIVIDRRGRVLVADRDNARVQIFDQEGNFLDQWTHLGSPYSLFITEDDVLYISDGVNSKIWIAQAEDGALLGTIEDTPGVHWAAVDAAGTVYAASNRSQYLRKYEPLR